MTDPNMTSYGQSNYAAKKAARLTEKEAAISVDDLGEAFSGFRENLGSELGHAVSTIKDSITPEFWLRFQRKKLHFKRIVASEK